MVISSFLLYAFGYSHWQWCYPLSACHRAQTSQLHVPVPSLTDGGWPHNYPGSVAQAPLPLLVQWSGHICHCLFHPDVFHPWSICSTISPTCCNGLWPLHGCVWAITLQHNLESYLSWTPGTGGPSQRCDSYSAHASSISRVDILPHGLPHTYCDHMVVVKMACGHTRPKHIYGTWFVAHRLLLQTHPADCGTSQLSRCYLQSPQYLFSPLPCYSCHLCSCTLFISYLLPRSQYLTFCSCSPCQSITSFTLSTQPYHLWHKNEGNKAQVGQMPLQRTCIGCEHRKYTHE